MTAGALPFKIGIDPLIVEAKQRMRRRRRLLIALVTAVALAASLTVVFRPFGTEWTGRPGAWVPPGVQEIDVHGYGYSGLGKATPISRRITDPAKVKSIVLWFDALRPNPSSEPVRNGVHFACAGGWVASVSFTFRAANSDSLARASSTAGTATYCDPIGLAAGSRTASFLLDRHPERPLIGRVDGLLGVTFRNTGYLG